MTDRHALTPATRFCPEFVRGIVKHPALPLLFGSTWALAPEAAAVIVVRMFLEDRAFHRDLPGYEEYARRTPWRLIPHAW